MIGANGPEHGLAILHVGDGGRLFVQETPWRSEEVGTRSCDSLYYIAALVYLVLHLLWGNGFQTARM